MRPRTTREGQTLNPLSNVEHVKNWIFNGVSAYCEVLAQRRMIQPSKVTTNCQRANRHDTRYDKQYKHKVLQDFRNLLALPLVSQILLVDLLFSRTWEFVYKYRVKNFLLQCSESCWRLYSSGANFEEHCVTSR